MSKLKGKIEARMTKHLSIPRLDLWLRYFFVIRHSRFVILHTPVNPH